jgi:hypothetical protein
VACSATAGQPSAEVCNGADDDCDGATDEADPGLCAATGQFCFGGSCQCPSGQGVCGGTCMMLVSCLADGDEDRYASSSTPVMRCPDATRASYGFCPAGFVSTGASLGSDCNDSDANRFRSVFIRVDADQDRWCIGGLITQCVGSSLPPGMTLESSCSGYSDCDDSNAAWYQVLSVRTDGDGDGRCIGGALSQCAGAAARPGFRLATSCLADDCNDGNGALHTALTVRADQDNDGWCVGAPFVECSGANPNAGRRLPASCNGGGDDCRDTNVWANATCTLNWATTTALKRCELGLPPQQTFFVSENEPTSFGCPNGFSLVGGSVSSARVAGPVSGTCEALAATTIRATCPAFALGEFQCRNEGVCAAW